MPIFIVKKSISSADKGCPSPLYLLNQADKLSGLSKSGKPPDSLASEQQSLKDELVRLLSRNTATYGPVVSIPPEVIHDCKTLSKTALRIKYAYTANSHRNMLRREITEGAIIYPAWRTFKGFLLSFGPRLPDTTLHRIDNGDPEYAPGKCKWA